MSSIGELATFYPVSGSFSSYATRFIDPSIGFTMDGCITFYGL